MTKNTQVDKENHGYSPLAFEVDNDAVFEHNIPQVKEEKKHSRSVTLLTHHTLSHMMQKILDNTQKVKLVRSIYVYLNLYM